MIHDSHIYTVATKGETCVNFTVFYHNLSFLWYSSCANCGSIARRKSCRWKTSAFAKRTVAWGHVWSGPVGLPISLGTDQNLLVLWEGMNIHLPTMSMFTKIQGFWSITHLSRLSLMWDLGLGESFLSKQSVAFCWMSWKWLVRWYQKFSIYIVRAKQHAMYEFFGDLWRFSGKLWTHIAWTRCKARERTLAACPARIVWMPRETVLDPFGTKKHCFRTMSGWFVVKDKAFSWQFRGGVADHPRSPFPELSSGCMQHTIDRCKQFVTCQMRFSIGRQ